MRRGILYMDTAEGYADGASEAQLGRALAKLSAAERARVLVGTKILPNSCGDVRGHVEQMRGRLQVDCIDLVMIHWPITVEGMAHFAGDHKTASGGHDYATSDVASVGEVPSTQVCTTTSYPDVGNFYYGARVCCLCIFRLTRHLPMIVSLSNIASRHQTTQPRARTRTHTPRWRW